MHTLPRPIKHGNTYRQAEHAELQNDQAAIQCWDLYSFPLSFPFSFPHFGSYWLWRWWFFDRRRRGRRQLRFCHDGAASDCCADARFIRQSYGECEWQRGFRECKRERVAGRRERLAGAIHGSIRRATGDHIYGSRDSVDREREIDVERQCRRGQPQHERVFGGQFGPEIAAFAFPHELFADGYSVGRKLFGVFSAEIDPLPRADTPLLFQ
jgi:hypothetical protein